MQQQFDLFLFCLRIAAIKNGDLDRLLVPTDSKNRKCGVDNGVINKPNLLFFNLEKCIDARVPLVGCKTTQVCVEQCPTTSFIYNEYNCNGNTINQIRSQLICEMEVDLAAITDCALINKHINEEKCARWYLPSTKCKYADLHCRSIISLHFCFIICLFRIYLCWHFYSCEFCNQLYVSYDKKSLHFFLWNLIFIVSILGFHFFESIFFVCN